MPELRDSSRGRGVFHYKKHLLPSSEDIDSGAMSLMRIVNVARLLAVIVTML